MKEKKKSRFVGVHWHIRRQKWISTITIDGRKCEIGSFDNEIEAAKAYDRKAFVAGRKTNILKFKAVLR